MKFWIYISILFIVLFFLIYIRFKNKYQDPFGNLDIQNKKNIKE